MVLEGLLSPKGKDSKTGLGIEGIFIHTLFTSAQKY